MRLPRPCKLSPEHLLACISTHQTAAVSLPEHQRLGMLEQLFVDYSGSGIAAEFGLSGMLFSEPY